MTSICDCPRSGNAPSLSCQAAHRLFCAYHDHAGAEGYELCARLGVPIHRRDIKPLSAYLEIEETSIAGVRITLPEIDRWDASAREALLIYHELAHFFLCDTSPFFRRTRYHQTELDASEETWCDNFALAMLLAHFGWQPFGLARAGHAFLRRGEKLKWPRSNILLAYRLRREMRRPRKRNRLAPTPLYLLANALLNHACSSEE